MQCDIDSLVLWSKKWQLPFNISKCKVFTSADPSQITLIKYVTMQIIEQVTEEKDLGILIIINNQLKFHQHVSFATMQ